jgi:hypothetical protein
MCKVEVLVENESDFQTFQSEFTRAMTQSLPNGTIRRIDEPDGRSTVVAYLARRDHSLPSWRPEE